MDQGTTLLLATAIFFFFFFTFTTHESQSLRGTQHTSLCVVLRDEGRLPVGLSDSRVQFDRPGD